MPRGFQDELYSLHVEDKSKTEIPALFSQVHHWYGDHWQMGEGTRTTIGQDLKGKSGHCQDYDYLFLEGLEGS